MGFTNHPAHGPVSLDRLHQISEILSKASAQSDGGNLGYAMADAVKVIDGAIAAFGDDKETTHNSIIAEQLAYVLSSLDVNDHQRAIITCSVDRLNKNAEMLQQAPSSQQAPEKLDYQGAKELFNYLMTEEETNATVNGWNACRAAMLQAGNHTEQHLDMVDNSGDDNEKANCRLPFAQWLSQQNEPIDVDCGCVTTEAFYHWLRVAYEAGNTPVIPDGSAMVPIKPTEDMIIDGFESEPDEDFSDPDVWEKYQAMSGCQQAAHRARLCWAAMIAAAPKLEDGIV